MIAQVYYSTPSFNQFSSLREISAYVPFDDQSPFAQAVSALRHIAYPVSDLAS